MLLHPSHACLQLWRFLLQMEMALSFCLTARRNVWTLYSSHYSFLLQPLILMLQMLALVCDCTEVIGYGRQ